MHVVTTSSPHACSDHPHLWNALFSAERACGLAAQIASQVNNFLAGHETTAAALAFMVYHIASNPAAEARLLAEVDAFGRDDSRRPGPGALHYSLLVLLSPALLVLLCCQLLACSAQPFCLKWTLSPLLWTPLCCSCPHAAASSPVSISATPYPAGAADPEPLSHLVQTLCSSRTWRR